MIIQSGWWCLYWESIVCISSINYHGLFLFFHHGVQRIWIWSKWYLALESCCIAFALHSITWHLELCREPMVVTVPVQHRLLGITMPLHTLSGMKAGDMAFALHMHYDFGLWYICFGFRILERYWGATFSKACWWLVFILHMKYLFGLLYLMDYHWFTFGELHLHNDFGIWNVCLGLWLGR